MTTANGNMGRLKCNDDNMMGMLKFDEDYDNGEDVVKDEDFVKEILKD